MTLPQKRINMEKILGAQKTEKNRFWTFLRSVLN